MSDSVQPPSTVETVLQDLAEQSATGCLVVRDPEGDEAQVYLREGGIYAVNVPGRRAMLGVRLVSSGALTSEALAEALEVQRTELEGWRLGELLIHLGYVEPAVVEASVVDHMTDALADLVGRPMASWRFRKRKKTRQDTGPRTLVQTLFDDLRERGRAWDAILDVIGSADTAPTAAPKTKKAPALEPNEKSLLNKIDGRRSIADIASECGFTLFEAGQIIVRLMRAQLVQIEGRAAPDEDAGLDKSAKNDAAEADHRAGEDKKRAATERKAEARRQAEAKAKTEAARIKIAAEHRREEAEKAEALELRRLAAQRKQEQAERIRAAAEEREAATERRRRILEEERIAEAEILHRELEAARVAAEEAAALELKKKADALAAKEAAALESQRQSDALAAEQKAAAEAETLATAERARLAAEEVTRIAQAAADLAVEEAAERIVREEASQQKADQERVEEERAAGQKAILSADASNLLTQLSNETDEVAALVPAQAQAVEEAEQLDQSEEALPARQNDTAMLLRELSSLNFGSDDAPSAAHGSSANGVPPAPPTPAQPVPPLPTENKKKKRLFGR